MMTSDQSPSCFLQFPCQTGLQPAINSSLLTARMISHTCTKNTSATTLSTDRYFQPGYQDRVRNLVTNFSYSSGLDVTFRYTFPSADLKAAVQDHDYLMRPYTEYWVDKSNKVSGTMAEKIQKATKGQANSQRWHEERRWRLTASNFGTLCKITSRCNVQKLCKRMLFPKLLQSRPLLHGRHYEKIAIEEFEKKFDLKVEPCGLFVSEIVSFLACTPDGLVGDDSLVEVKCPYTGRNEKITPGKKFPFLLLDKDVLSLRQSHSYYMQVQGQLFLTKRKLCYFVVYTFQDLKVIEVPVDMEYCTLSLVPKLQCFYEKHYRPFIAANWY